MTKRQTKLRNLNEISDTVIIGIILKHEEKNKLVTICYYLFTVRHLTVWSGTNILTVKF